MNGRRLLSYFVTTSLAASALAFLPPDATDVPLRPDGSVILRSRERITLWFDEQDGKLINPKVVPSGTQSFGPVTFWVERTGGKRTMLGPVTPIRDILHIENRLSGAVVVRCSYTTPDVSKPRTIPSTRDGRSFDGPITEATLSNFTLKKQ